MGAPDLVRRPRTLLPPLLGPLPGLGYCQFKLIIFADIDSIMCGSSILVLACLAPVAQEVAWRPQEKLGFY